jgi:hypothetical protein
MMRSACYALCVVSLSMAFAGAQAQEAAGRAAARAPAAAPPPEQLEPAVNTSAAAPSDAAAAPAAGPAPAATVTQRSDSVPASAAGARSTTGTNSATAARSTAGSKSTAAAGAPGSPKSGARAAKGPDRVELDTTDITGNRELPKVLYIVPWKRSDLGDLVGRPPNSLLDEVLQPIDREVFLRENRYYEAVRPDAAAAHPGAVPGSGEKP